MVQDIEIYGDVIKVILKPTKKFPNGYFYTDNNPIARELIESYSWFLTKQSKQTYVVANVDFKWLDKKTLNFHKEYRERLDNICSDYVDHINGLGIDNRDSNLNIVTNQQNRRNALSIGYTVGKNCFQPNYYLNGKTYTSGHYKTESEALLATYQLRRQVYYDYDYNFYLDRRGDSDILDAELTRKITAQQAIYYHVKRYVENNPWYTYRYNLFEYCKQHNINIPAFKLDNQGFMIHPVTGERLCPY